MAAIQAGVDLVMSSHPYYPNLDPDPKKIATFSRSIMYDLLRRELNFSGVIASDDLEMGAIKAMCPIGEAGVLATRAGHDLLLVCHDLNAQKEVYYTVLEAYRRRQLPWEELAESVARIRLLIARREERFAGGELEPEPAGAGLAASICRESVRVLRDEKKLLPLRPEGRSVGVIFPRFSSLDAKIMIEKEVLSEKDFLQKEFQAFGLAPDIQIVGLEPTESDIAQAANLARSADLTILFCYDAHLYPSNKELVDAVQESARNLVVDLLRDPYDVEYLKDGVASLTAFGWRACQIKAAIAGILGQG
jgi:beta-N-acetylhexosaminidase